MSHQHNQDSELATDRIRQRDSESEKELTSIPPKNHGNTVGAHHHNHEQHPHAPTQQFHVKEAPHLPGTAASLLVSPRLGATKNTLVAMGSPRNSNGNDTNTLSPSVDVGKPVDAFFPSNPSPSASHKTAHHHHHNTHELYEHQHQHDQHHPTSISSQTESACVKTIHHHHHAVASTNGASLERGASPRNSNNNNNNGKDGGDNNLSSGMGSKQQSSVNGAAKIQNQNETAAAINLLGRGPSPSQAGSTTTANAESSFIQKASAKLVSAMEITTIPDSKIPPFDELFAIAQEIADKLFDKGIENARTQLSDLVMSMRDPSNEDLRARIRNRVVSAEDVVNMKLMDLMNAAQKAELQLEQEKDFKEHNMSDITRATATVTKETCPSCNHKEAAVLETNSAGGQPRFWSGGELEEQQQLTLYRCLNCSHEWSGESKY